MTKTEYRKVRKLIRENGRYALRWLTDEAKATMDHLLFNIQDSTDRLAERASIVAYCKREGIYCNVRHTS